MSASPPQKNATNAFADQSMFAVRVRHNRMRHVNQPRPTQRLHIHNFPRAFLVTWSFRAKTPLRGGAAVAVTKTETLRLDIMEVSEETFCLLVPTLQLACSRREREAASRGEQCPGAD